jgi:hypothetical protein
MPATGPVTIEGKARSSRNATVHGLTASSFELLPGEDPVAFELHVIRLRASWSAMDDDTVELVERLASAEWRLARARRLEGRAVLDETLEEEARARRLATYGRYIRAIERSMIEARRELLHLKEERRLIVAPDDPAIEALADRYEELMAGEPEIPAHALPDREVKAAPPPSDRPVPPLAPTLPLVTPNRAERRRQQALARKQAA